MKRSVFIKGKKFKYEPIGFDALDPQVIKGTSIQAGAIVKVVKTNFDPCHKFVGVEDDRGNVQGVDKKSLCAIKG